MGSGQFFQNLVTEMGEALITWNICGEITSWNRAAESLLGHSQEDMIGRNAALLVPADLLQEHESVVQEVLGTGQPARLATARCRADGSSIEVALSLSRITDADGRVLGMGCLMRSRMRTSRLINRLRRRAYTDNLTRALNRAGIENHLTSSESRRNGALRAVVFIDLDGFKRVNDEIGHCRGDQLLRRCARRLRNTLAEGDHVLGRWGGDEFVVILENLPRAQASARKVVESLCSELLAALRPAYRFGSRTYRCPASIGACIFDSSRTPYAAALEVADRAMYEVKASGKDAFALDEDLPVRKGHLRPVPNAPGQRTVPVTFGNLALS